MRRSLRAAVAALIAAIAVAAAVRGARAQVDLPDGLQDSLVVGGIDFPVGLAFLPDGRLFVTEQIGARVRLLVNGAFASSDPVVTIPDVRSAPYTEQGLLGIAVDPGWPARPYVYVHHDRSDSLAIRIARFTVTGDLDFTGNGALSIDPASRRDILTDIPDNYSNHNGGTVRFGTDGRLYVSLGEDAANPCAAQDSTTFRGVILRLDVSGLPPGPGGPPFKSAIAPADNPFPAHPNENARLVWATGLRNPFRFWVDPANGDLFIGDVGQGTWEEVDWLPASAKGANFGWPFFEGPAPFTTCAQGDGLPFRDPIYYYDPGGTSAITGAIPYRRGASPGAAAFPAEYEGDVFVGDYYPGFVRRLHRSGNTWAIAVPVSGQPSQSNWATGFGGVSDWAIAPDGALWYSRQHDGSVARFSGSIGRVAPGPGPPPPPPPAAVRFLPPYPSPARGSITFPFTLVSTARVELRIFDERGRLVRKLLDAVLDPGVIPAEAFWDGRTDDGERATPGLYFARLTIAGRDLTRRFPLIP